mmetsp:Transcript_478/g.1079  ORF Transcript_478/g.1079 Transcript_478/m.1079 type:complete len:223 (-) Transcript_478:324-992(-)
MGGLSRAIDRCTHPRALGRILSGTKKSSYASSSPRKWTLNFKPYLPIGSLVSFMIPKTWPSYQSSITPPSTASQLSFSLSLPPILLSSLSTFANTAVALLSPAFFTVSEDDSSTCTLALPKPVSEHVSSVSFFSSSEVCCPEAVVMVIATRSVLEFSISFASSSFPSSSSCQNISQSFPTKFLAQFRYSVSESFGVSIDFVIILGGCSGLHRKRVAIYRNSG